MAEVRIKLGVCFSCEDKVFTLSDNTGPWDSTTNPYGWAPEGSGSNIEIGDVESSGLTITSPSGVVYGPYDILATLPALAGTTLEVDPADIFDSGNGEAFSDGEWIFDWSVQGVYGISDTPFHSRCVVQRFPLCTVECCVDNLIAKANCKCGKGGDNKSINAFLTLEAAKGAWRCGKKEAAKAHLVKLQDICNNNCQNC